MIEKSEKETQEKEALYTIETDSNLKKWKVNINETDVTPIGEKLKDKDLLDKEYLGFNLSDGKLKWIVQPDNSINHNYLSNLEVKFGWDTGFSSVKNGLEKRWELAKLIFLKLLILIY